MTHSICDLFLQRIRYAALLLCMAVALNSCSSSAKIKHIPVTADPLSLLREQIHSILGDSLLDQSRVGLKIVSLDRDETLFEQNNRVLFHPASNMKLLTTAAALSYLGPDFSFETRIGVDSAAFQNQVVNGDIYLKGFGNPDLVTDDLREMVAALQEIGVTEVTGDIVCDNSYLDDLFWGSGWMWDDASAWYWAQISALTVNDNCVEVAVMPGASPGDSLLVRVKPPTAFISVRNEGTTLAAADSLVRKKFKTQREWKQPRNTVVIEGGLYAGEEERTYTIDVIDADLYVGTLLGELLRDAGIGFSGKVIRGLLPDTNQILISHFSPPLTAAVINTNKISDNLSAELLLKVVGAEVKSAPGTAAKGISVIYKFLDSLGVDSTSYTLADGSGVSRYNLVTPDLIIELLRGMHNDFTVQAEYKASLPIAGVDGSLRSRMKGGAAHRNLRAKTGSLSGVSSLAGYSTTANNELIAFSMIMEHFIVPTSRIRNIQDRIGELISGFSRKPERP